MIPAQHTREAPSGDYYKKKSSDAPIGMVEWFPFFVVVGLFLVILVSLYYGLGGNKPVPARVIFCDRHVEDFSDAGTPLGRWDNIYVDDARYGSMKLVDSKMQNIDATYDCYVNAPETIQPEVGMAPDPSFNECVRVFAGLTLMAEFHHVRVDDARYGHMELSNRFGQAIECVYDNYTAEPEGAQALASKGTGGNF